MSLDKTATTTLLGTTDVNLSRTRGQGTIHLHTKTACLDLQEALYAPQLQHMLLALRKATANGARVILEPDGSLEMTKQGEIIAAGFWTNNNLYQLHECRPQTNEMPHDKVQEAAALLTETEVWHEHFCHFFRHPRTETYGDSTTLRV